MILVVRVLGVEVLHVEWADEPEPVERAGEVATTHVLGFAPTPPAPREVMPDREP